MLEDQARAILSSHGFQLRFRHDDWIECLVVRGREAYVGHGLDRVTALENALDRAFPTPLARRLFDAACGAMALPAPDVAPADVDALLVETLRAPSGQPAGLPSSPLAPVAHGVVHASPLAASAPAATAADASLESEPRSQGQIAVIVSRPRPALVAAPVVGGGLPSIVPGVNAPTVPPPGVSIPPPLAAVPSLVPAPVGEVDSRVFGDVERSLEALDVLMDRVRDAREELGSSAPERQRLAMLSWICEARSHADAFPDDVRVRDRVGAISRQLTDFGKTFWPGSVTALQLHMQPRDLPRHLIGGTATSWYRAAELAEAALRQKELEDERKGYDAYGFADAKMLAPRPAQPARLMMELVDEIEALSGRLSTYAQPAEASARPEPDVFARWVRMLRWLRGSDVDLDAWARVAGRLRWWAFRRDPQLQAAARELEATFSPQQPWAQLITGDPEFKRIGLRMLSPIERVPRLDPSEPRKQLLEWLSRTLPFAARYLSNVAQAVEPYRTLVLSLHVDELPELHRRLEPELLALQALLRDGRADDPGELPRVDREVDASFFIGGGVDEALALPGVLLERIRGVTSGKRSVFVSNRRDPDLQASIQDAFRFAAFDCRIAEAKRMQALGEAIESGQYDFVLSAIGFQLQGLDQALSRACRAAGVAYLRVNRGQPLACLRAFARELDARVA
jgi:hypothetical protein